MEPRVVRPKRTLAMSEKILIVDDEPSNRNILGQELTHEGYSVLAASDGREALRKVESSRPDLIILDYMMPDLSGLEVLKELRKRENDTPVVMITAYGTMERAVETMKEGAYDLPGHLSRTISPWWCGKHWNSKGSSAVSRFSRRRSKNAIVWLSARARR